MRTVTQSLVASFVAALVFFALPASSQAQSTSSSQLSTSTQASKSNTASSSRRSAKNRRKAASSPKRRMAVAVAPRPTIGQLQGLHKVADPLDLRSSVAMVIDDQSGEVLFEKNSTAVLPIASITKLMTALVVMDANQPLDEVLTIDKNDVDTEKGTRSRLGFGTKLTRADALHLALMASENRAASTLGRHYPGGIDAFVDAMNDKARALGMASSRFVDSSGLSPSNRSTGRDLVKLAQAAYQHSVIRQYSTSPDHFVNVGRRTLKFASTNKLIKNSDWSIGLQKTGFINEAGQCLVMQATVEGRSLFMVLLDAQGRYSRFADAGRLRNWLEVNMPVQVPRIDVPPIQTKSVMSISSNIDVKK